MYRSTISFSILFLSLGFFCPASAVADDSDSYRPDSSSGSGRPSESASRDRSTRRSGFQMISENSLSTKESPAKQFFQRIQRGENPRVFGPQLVRMAGIFMFERKLCVTSFSVSIARPVFVRHSISRTSRAPAGS